MTYGYNVKNDMIGKKKIKMAKIWRLRIQPGVVVHKTVLLFFIGNILKNILNRKVCN